MLGKSLQDSRFVARVKKAISVPLLSREEEVKLAQKIEEGEAQITAEALSSVLALHWALDLGEKVATRQVDMRNVVSDPDKTLACPLVGETPAILVFEHSQAYLEKFAMTIKTKHEKLTVLQVATLNQPVRPDLGYGLIETIIHNIDKGLHSLGHQSIVACSGDSRVAGEHYVTVDQSIGDYWSDNTPEQRKTMIRHLPSNSR